MATAKKNITKRHSRYTTSDGHSYLTKRIVVAKAQSAGRRAAANAMKTMGFVVVADDGVIVKKFADGTIEVIANV